MSQHFKTIAKATAIPGTKLSKTMIDEVEEAAKEIPTNGGGPRYRKLAAAVKPKAAEVVANDSTEGDDVDDEEAVKRDMMDGEQIEGIDSESEEAQEEQEERDEEGCEANNGDEEAEVDQQFDNDGEEDMMDEDKVRIYNSYRPAVTLFKPIVSV